MATERSEGQPITIYPIDRAIVEAVQKRNGAGFSGAVRFILRDWARLSGLEATLNYSSTEVTQEYVKAAETSQKRKPRKVSPRKRLSTIPGVTRGVKVN